MGSTLMGTPTKQVGTTNLLTPEQQSYLSQVLGSSTPQAASSLQSLLQPYSEDFFQKSVVQPSLQQYQQQILPQIGQAFGSQNLGSSSALNQALAQSAQDLASSLAGQRINLQQSQAQQNLGGLGVLGNLLGQRTFEPVFQQGKKGILGDVLGLAGTLGGGFLSGSLGASTGGALGRLLSEFKKTPQGSYTPYENLRR